MKLRLMLVDDHAMYREGLRMFLELAPDIEVACEVDDGDDVLREFEQTRPDVVVMDISMPGLGGIDATRALLAVAPTVKVIGLSAHFDLSRVAQMVDAGALGYVVKGSPIARLLEAVRTVSLNQHYFDPELGVSGADDLAPYLNYTAPE